MIRQCLMALIILVFTSLSAYSNSNLKTVNTDHLSLCNTTNINIIFVLDVGSAELYLPDCKVLDYSDFLLAITYNRPFTKQEFIASSDELIARNNSAETYKKIKDELDKFNSKYLGVEKGDEYRISYTENFGLILQKNSKLISSSTDTDLARAYFKVWFGDKPFHQKMKKNLLKNITIIADEQSKK